ncbi:MAG: MerR family transcriptional regulator [Gammaproteobacteria bacterium]|nr:MerR family transcriptional regulator [Gammaproteobacteria bacterium]MDH5275660.1 MerR family transcriptional regulator [Gammaproteobacteria bacterium]
MPGARSYSLSELVEAAGFDRRTIVYYIQSGLLPKVGRRGPHTRYPETCLTRLLFIKGVKALQAEGRLLTATLAEIGRALAARDDAGIRDLLDRNLPVDELEALFAENPAPAPPVATPAPVPAPVAAMTTAAAAPQGVRGPSGDRRSYGLADAGIRKRPPPERPAAPGPPEVPHEDSQPGLEVLNPEHLRQQASAADDTAAPVDGDLGHLLRELEVRPSLNARRSPPGAPEQWTEIPITGRVYLSVRGLSTEDAPIAEAVVRVLKRALRSRA